MKNATIKKLIFLGGFFCSLTILGQIPTTGLLGYYPFSGNANDASGNAQHGTVNGATLTTDRFGNSSSAYNFNGVSDYISLPAGTFTTLNIYSYSCWIKPTSFSLSFAMCFGESSYGYCQTLVFQSTGSITAAGYNYGSNPVQSYMHSPGTYSLNQWLHLVMTRDLTNIKLYINGSLISSPSTANTNGQNANYGSNLPIKAWIGARTTSTNYFSGSIDDVRIYNNVLTQSDVTALYNESCFQNVTTTHTLCAGNSATLTATPSPSNTINWHASLTSTATIGSGTLYTTPTLSTAGVYTYYASASSCTLSNQRMPITVAVNTVPTISAPSGTICSGALFGINPSGAFSYTYSNGSTVSPTVTTTYTVIGKSFEGCLSNVATVTVNVNATPTVNVNSGFVCNGQSFTLSPTGATSYTYSGGSAVVAPVVNTSYTVTGTTGNGCYSSAVANVGVVASPTLIITNPGNICAGNSATLSVSGANFYTWDSGATSATITVTPAVTTNYTVSGVNLFGCLTTTVTIVNVNPYPVISVNSGSVCSGKSFTLVPSGAATYTYSSGSSVVSPVASTSYSVTGTSAQGCPSSNTAVSNVTVMAVPAITANSGTICSGSTFTMTPTGGISYTFSSGSAVVTPTVNTSYTVTGSGPNGCTADGISNVTVQVLPVLNITSPGSICMGNTALLSVSGAITYTWGNGANTQTIAVSPPGTSFYSVSGTDVYGCMNTANITLTVNPIPVISVNNGSICSGNSFTMVPSGASTYTYSSGSNVVSPLTNTSYSVTGTSAQGCVSSNTAISNVSVMALPFVTVNSGSICTGQAFAMIPAGALSYSFSGGTATVMPSSNTTYTVRGTDSQGCVSSPALSNVTVVPLPVVTVNSGSICSGSSFTMVPSGAISYTFSSGSAIVSPVSSTSYSVTGTGPSGCVSSVAVSSVTVNTLPFITVNSGTICSGKSFTLLPSGAISYTYSNGSSIVTPVTSTSYSVTGTSAQGCLSSNTAVASVTVLSLPLITVNSGSVCAGGIFTMIPAGAFSYTFSNGSSTVIPTVNTSYSVTGTSSAGCISSNTAVSIVTVNPLPLLSITGATTICNGSATTLTASGATSYSWSTGSGLNVISVNPSANITYTVQGTDPSGCSNNASQLITVNPLPTITVNSGAICIGSSFSIIASGASTYSYSGSSSIVAPTTSTNYAVTGTSAAGCLSSNTAISTVSVNPLPTIVINAIDTVCFGQTALLNASGAATYSWSTGSTGASLNVMPSVTSAYTVTGTSAGGCVNTGAQLITVNPLPTIIVSGGAVCPGNSFTLNPSGAFTYTYSSGSNVVSPSSTSSYTISGTSSEGCVASVPVVATVSVVNTLTITISGNTAICQGQTANLTASGASTYSWNTGALTNTIALAPPVTSNYTVMGISGTCSNSAVVSVSVNPLPVVSVNSGAICTGDSFTMVPTGALTYTFSNGFPVVAPSSTSSYSVSGSDVNGCISLPAISSVTVNPLPSVLATTSSSLICEGETATITANGATSYTWSNGSTGNSISINPVISITYTLTGQDLNGCINSVTLLQTVDPCTGITGLRANSPVHFLVYPNPNTGAFSIAYDLKDYNRGRINIIDLQGKTLMSFEVDRSAKLLKIKNSELKPGVYFCELNLGDRSVSVEKIIITN